MPLSRNEIEKNRLDLLYQKKLQEMNAFYIAATTGIIGFIGTFIWFPEKFVAGGLFSVTVFGTFFYKIVSVEREMNSIILDLNSLKSALKH